MIKKNNKKEEFIMSKMQAIKLLLENTPSEELKKAHSLADLWRASYASDSWNVNEMREARNVLYCHI